MYDGSGIVYADVLFLINFAMDFLALVIAGRLCRRGARTLRLVAASLLGGAYAFAPYYMSGLPTAAKAAIHLAAAAVILFAAFGAKGGIRAFLKAYTAFILSCALIGGIMTGLYSLSGGGGGRYRYIAICAISALIALGYGAVARNRIGRRSCRIRFTAGNETVTADLLVDSGNLVTEPFSALPVIILSHTALPPPYDDPESEFFPLAVRAIPITTGTGSGCVFGFRPEKAELLYIAKKPKAIDAYIGVDKQSAGFSGYDGLLPAELI